MSAEKPFSEIHDVTVRTTRGVTIATIVADPWGRHDHLESIASEALQAFDEQPSKGLILDIRNAPCLSSSFINLSIILWKKVSGRGGKFAILTAPGFTSTVTDVMPMFWSHDPWFPICDDEEVAIRNMTGAD